MKKVYCPTCDKEVEYRVVLYTEPITIFDTTRMMKILEPQCLECGNLLDVRGIEHINTNLINIKFGDVLKR